MTQKPDRELEFLISQVKKESAKPDIELIKKAYDFSKEAHKHQKRMSDEPYFVHPYNTALVLADFGADSEMIAAALLHDVIEDTKATAFEIKNKFGESVYYLVDGVTKFSLSKKMKSREDIAAIQKLLSTSARDLKVVIIKIADKLHNVRTLHYLPKESRERIAKEVISIYAPIAHRLGLRVVEKEMNDRCFAILEPQLFSEIKESLDQKIAKKNKEITQMIRHLKKVFPKNDKIEFSRSEQGVYKNYVKSLRKGSDPDAIYDQVILTIITKNSLDCYKVLGLLHREYTPIPGKFKDYITLPQNKIHSALHSSVIGPAGKPVKVYIMTQYTNRIFEKGVISRIGKDGWIGMKDNFSDKIESANKLMVIEGIEKAETLFMKALKSELSEESMFIFSNYGKAYEMPIGATALDFAYAQYGENAHKAWRVMINSQMERIKTELKAGDIVEILFSNVPQIETSWLKFTKTPTAHAMISAFLKKFNKETMKEFCNFELIIETKRRPNILNQILKEINSQKIDICGTISNDLIANRDDLYFNFRKKDIDKVKRIAPAIKRIDGVIDVVIQ